MRVVIDNNVLISALLSPRGVPSQVIDLWQQRKFDVCTSPDTLAEFHRVVHYPKIAIRLRDAEKQVVRLAQELRDFTIHFIETPTVDAVPADPADNIYIALALAAEATHIVSGDKHLLNLVSYAGIPITTPAVFLELFENL